MRERGGRVGQRREGCQRHLIVLLVQWQSNKSRASVLERGERGWQGSVNESMRKRERRSEKRYWSPDVYYNQLNHVSFTCHLVIEWARQGNGRQDSGGMCTHSYIFKEIYFDSHLTVYSTLQRQRRDWWADLLKEVGVPHEHAICMCTHHQVRWIGIRKHRRRGCTCSKTKQRHGGCLVLWTQASRETL